MIQSLFFAREINLIDFVPQNYLNCFASMLRTEIICMIESARDCNGVQHEFFKVVYSGQQIMKRYSFIRSYLIDSDLDGSEDSCEKNANACFLQN